MTYPHPEVRRELGYWVERKVDVDAAPGVAELFGVTAVPVAIALTADGRILSRVPSFVDPDVFSRTLAEIRRRSAATQGD